MALVKVNQSVAVNTTTAGEFNAVYAVPFTATYAEIFPIQVANILASTDSTMTVRWLSYRNRTQSGTQYWGDGRRVKHSIWNIPKFQLIRDTLVPAGTSLSIIDYRLTLWPGDVVQIKAAVLNAGSITMSITECYPEGTTPQLIPQSQIQQAFGAGAPNSVIWAPSDIQNPIFEAGAGITSPAGAAAPATPGGGY